MKTSFQLLSLLALKNWIIRLPLLTTTTTTTIASAEETEHPECGLYLAVSSTSTAEDPKWGLFAGNFMNKSDTVGYGELAIQTFNLIANSYGDSDEGDEDEDNIDPLGALPGVVDFFEQFIWVPNSSGGQYEMEDSSRIVTAIPGVGVIGGYNPKLTNADWNHTLAYHRPAWGEQAGVAHPGRGASTSYFEVTLSTIDDIPAGMEIFINYGDNWEPEEDSDGEESITLEDHPKVDETIDKMIEFFEKHKDELDPQSKQELYQFLIQDVLYAAAGRKKGKIIADLLPDTPDKLKEVKADGGSLKLTYPKSLKTISWLAEHGRCMDNLRPGPSLIPNAGRGAFATRALNSGAAIAPMPLVQIADGGIMNMYPLETKLDEDDEEFDVRKKGAERNGKQLLLNYCLGHPESKMLFFPAGSITSFINHSPEPNAKLIWSEHPANHLHWLELEPTTLQEEGNAHLGLLMEVVALRDIVEGEEITIDYGTEWATAWANHEAEWKAKNTEKTWPLMSIDYNNMFIGKPFPTNEEEYPVNVAPKCFLMVKKPATESPVNENGDKIRHWTGSTSNLQSENLFSCSLEEVEEIETPEGAASWNYTIKWVAASEEVTYVKHVPHEAIVFVDKAETSDQHIVDAFRHYIGIPDEIFPLGPWRNLNEENDEEDLEDEGEFSDDEED